MVFLDRDELPPHWDRDALFGTNDSETNTTASDSEVGGGRRADLFSMNWASEAGVINLNWLLDRMTPGRFMLEGGA